MVKNYQKEINLLKVRITKSKRDSINNSEINTINDISPNNSNGNRNKTKRNNSLNVINNSKINNQIHYENNTLFDLANNTFKKALLKK